MDDTITRICPRTCDRCPDSGEEPGEPEGQERQGSYSLIPFKDDINCNEVLFEFLIYIH